MYHCPLFTMLSESAAHSFGNKVRIRACGVLVENDAILLVKHEGLGPAGFLWNPPGGGVQFGETVEQTVEREFLEETGLTVHTEKFLVFSEHIGDGLHALELFFKVKKAGGNLVLGTDPELEGKIQMMTDLRFWKRDEILQYPAFWFHKKTMLFLDKI